jgi:hypothetical protein
MPVRGFLVVAGQLAAVGAAAVAALVALHRIALLFLWVTVGEPASSLAFALDGALRTIGVETTSAAWPVVTWALVALPAIALLVRRYLRQDRNSLAILTGCACGLLFLVAWSYRFPALVIGAMLAVSLVHFRRDPRGPAMSWVLLVCAAAASLSPLDVSLRVHRNGPRLAVAVVGLLTTSVAQYESSGDKVVVGGCSSIYNEPRWVVIW